MTRFEQRVYYSNGTLTFQLGSEIPKSGGHGRQNTDSSYTSLSLLSLLSFLSLLSLNCLFTLLWLH